MKAEERKQMILDCAKRLFSQNGYFNTQISDIVKEANIARGTVYQYFKSKDDIFITIIDNGYKEWQRTLVDETKGINLSEMTPYDYVKFRLVNSLSHYAKDPELSNITLRMGFGLPEKLTKELYQLEDEIINQSIAEFSYGVENNILRKDLDIELTANILQGATMRVAYKYFIKKKTGAKAINKIADEIMKIFESGIFTD
jgi:TetR/AcrR family transcriptional regulator, fatty acid metabolism regulator protein